jgi:hypothetical protein
LYIWLLHNLVGNKWIYSLSCANIGKEFDIVKEYTIIFKKETYVVEVQAYNEMGETKWTPVIEDEIVHPQFLVLKEIIIIIIIIIIIPEILLLFISHRNHRNHRNLFRYSVLFPFLPL